MACLHRAHIPGSPVEAPCVSESPIDHTQPRLQHVLSPFGVRCRPETRVDLNDFTWFYWSAPLKLSAVCLADWFTSQTGCAELGDCTAIEGVPWIGGLAAWDWGPENLARRLGFFVHRTKTPSVDWFARRDDLEVMRVWSDSREGGDGSIAEKELGSAWFYHAVGSGMRLKDAPEYLCSPRGIRWRVGGSFPRREIVVRHGYSPHFWPPALEFKLGDGRTCDIDSQSQRILHCRNWQVPLWEARDTQWWNRACGA